MCYCLRRAMVKRTSHKKAPCAIARPLYALGYFFEPEDCLLRQVDKRQGLPARRLELRSQDGRLIGPDDAAVVSIGEIGFPYVAPSSLLHAREMSNDGER